MDTAIFFHGVKGVLAHGGLAYDDAKSPLLHTVCTPFFKAQAGGGHKADQFPAIFPLDHNGAYMDHGLAPLGFCRENVFFIKNIAVDTAAAGENFTA